MDSPERHGGGAFLGRAEELAAVLQKLRDGKDVTLVGPQGVGKSRLAFEVVAAWGEEAYFVGLADVAEESACLAAVAHAFGVSLDRARTPLESKERLAFFLSERRSPLVVFDNIEHLETTVLASLQDVVGASEGAVLLTSQRPMWKDGETLRLVGLSADVGLALFNARAERIGGYLRDQDAVLRLVAHVEALPLAIELAAARTHVLSPAQILSGLERDMSLLRSAYGPTSRHHSLYGAIDWSYSLLDEDERTCFEAVSVFRGGFSLQAAESLLADRLAEPVLDVLQRLVDRSILRTFLGQGDSPPVRFGMYRVIQAYAEDALANRSTGATLFMQHARYYLAHCQALYERMCQDADGQALRLLAEVQPNVHVAVERMTGSNPCLAAELVLAFDGYLRRVGPAGVRHERLNQMMRSVEGHDAVLWARLGVRRAESLAWFGDVAAGRALIARVVDGLSDEEAELQVLARIAQGRIAQRAGRFDEAQQLLEDASERARITADDGLRGRAFRALGALRDVKGDYDDGLVVLREALVIAREAGRREDVARSLLHMAPIQSNLGDWGGAVESLEEALPIFVACGFRRAEANVLVRLASLVREEDAHFVARRSELLGRALAIYEAYGEHLALGTTLYNMGVTHQVDGALTAATAQFERALQIFEEQGHRAYAALAIGRLGAARAEQGDVSAGEVAARRLQERSDVLGSYREAQGLVGALEAITDAARARSASPDEARRWLAASMETAERVRAQPAAVGVHRSMDRAICRVEFALAKDGTIGAADTLWIGEGASWVRGGDAPTTELSGRALLRRLLLGLAHASAPLDSTALFAIGWPDEFANRAAIGNRVRVALSTLRKAGLRSFLERDERGYFLKQKLRLYPSPHDGPGVFAD